MVKVIEKRELNWHVTCTKSCYSLLEATESDLCCDIDWENDVAIYVICPVCGAKVYGFHEIPYHIRDRVIEKAKSR